MRHALLIALMVGLAALGQARLHAPLDTRPWVLPPPPHALIVQPTGMFDDDNAHDCEGVILFVTLEDDHVAVELSRINEIKLLPRTAAGYPWGELAAVLAEYKHTAYFEDRTDLTIGGRGTTRPVSHGDLAQAIATAHQVGFTDAKLFDPAQRVAYRERQLAAEARVQGTYGQ